MAVKLTEKSMEVLNYVKDNGGRVSIPEITAALGRASDRSTGANVTDLQKKELVVREKVEVEGADKPVTYVVLTDAGKAWAPEAE
jgi:uncharacterized membrane protein